MDALFEDWSFAWYGLIHSAQLGVIKVAARGVKQHTVRRKKHILLEALKNDNVDLILWHKTDDQIYIGIIKNLNLAGCNQAVIPDDAKDGIGFYQQIIKIGAITGACKTAGRADDFPYAIHLRKAAIGNDVLFVVGVGWYMIQHFQVGKRRVFFTARKNGQGKGKQ